MLCDQGGNLLESGRPCNVAGVAIVVSDHHGGGNDYRERGGEDLVGHDSPLAEDADDGIHLVVRVPTCIWMVLVWVNADTACRPSSRPSPLLLYPPNGSSGYPSIQRLIQTVPARNCLAAMRALLMSHVQMPAERPYMVELAISMAWWRDSNVSTDNTGPKISSRAIDISGVTPAKTVGR